jgi:hypothetical protein
MRKLRTALVVTIALATSSSAAASGHRDAPIVTLDRAADIIDAFAFRKYDGSPTPIVVGGILNPSFNVIPDNRLDDGVNVNDVAFPATFPYLALTPSGRDGRHIDPGEPGCTAGVGAACEP